MMGYQSIINDDTIQINKLVEIVSKHFGLEQQYGEEKREHIIFDQMLKQKNSILFSIINKNNIKKT